MRKQQEHLTDDEYKIIRNKGIPAEISAFIVGRSTETVKCIRGDYSTNKKAKRVAAKKKRDETYRKDIEERFGGIYKNYHYWTKSEINLIMTSKKTDMELAKEIGVSIYALQKRRERELKKKKEELLCQIQSLQKK